MHLNCCRFRWAFTFAVFSLVLFGLTGCAAIGPRSISHGRAAYNAAINRTEDQQLLLAVVKSRYAETVSLLTVSGVVANVRFQATANVQAGIGPPENYEGNLVPFDGGLAYEENPTITYTPVSGERYLRKILAPIPLQILLLYLRTDLHDVSFFTVLVDRINDLRNPDFLDIPPFEPDPKFERFVELSEILYRAGVMEWLADPRENVEFNILITDYAPTYTDLVKEYLYLLELPMPAGKPEEIVLPVYFAFKKRYGDSVAMSTRSTGDLIQILRASVEIPQEHDAAGLAMKYPPVGLAGQGIRIRSQKERPETATVAVRHRGHWFYIDDTDMPTKLYYRLVRALWSMSISDSTDRTAAPVLTVPASR